LPRGGGVGGGSSDAAAVLRWAGYEDVPGAAVLGADVAFCLVGGRARVRGIGEIVEPLPFEPIDITLVVPPMSVSSPFVYRTWDQMGGPHTDGTNDLEAAAVSAFTALARWRDRIREATGVAPTLAGSGATWFLRGHHDLDDAFPDALVVRTATVP
jgi:4-diphosphocytidyl-2-C-methyl-D-erythritol kinase